MRLLVLGGCGSVGTEFTRDLLLTSKQFTQVTIADANLEKARSFAVELHDDRAAAVKSDVSSKETLIELMQGYDAVVNLAPEQYSLIAVMAAVAARKNYLDLGSHGHLPKQLALDSQAKDGGITVLLGCGNTPGISNMVVRYAASQMPELNEVSIAYALVRPIAGQASFLDRLLEQFTPDTPRHYYENGGFIQVGSLTGSRPVEFEAPVGLQEVFPVARSETTTLPRFIPGIKSVRVFGTWKPELTGLLRTLLDAGLMSKELTDVKGVKVVPRDVVRGVLLQQSAGSVGGVWAYYLCVECAGIQDKVRTVRRYHVTHPGMDRWGMTAPGKMRGIPASIGIQLMMRGGEVPRGVVSPESCFDPVEFISELARRDIHVTESTTWHRRLA